MKPLRILFAATIVTGFFTACYTPEAHEAEPDSSKVETPPDATNTDDTGPAGLDTNTTVPTPTDHHDYGSDEDMPGDTLQ